MIRSFKDDRTRDVFDRLLVRELSAELERTVYRKLLLLDAAQNLDDQKVPPGNRLEKLNGDRKGQHSIRVNDQYRICFVWRQGDAFEVHMADYH